jgi:hypothetical protein
VDAVRRFAGDRSFDLVWLPGIRPEDANRFQQLNEPLFFWHAADILGAPAAPGSLRTPFRLEAATDDRPFPTLSTTWPDLWQTLARGDPAEMSRLDAGLLIGAATLLLVGLASVVLIALPLLWLRQAAEGPPRPGARIRTFAYFGLVGIAFLFLEMAWIQRLQLFLGHPVYAATSVLAAFLVFAGLGSLWAQRRSDVLHHRRLSIAVGTILLFTLLYLLFLPGWLEALAGLPIALRIAIVLIFLAPLAFAMGIPFPTGLRNLGTASPQLIPWAWGINGCASVISAAAAPLLAVEVGLDGLITIAVVGYLMLPFIRLGPGEA